MGSATRSGGGGGAVASPARIVSSTEGGNGDASDDDEDECNRWWWWRAATGGARLIGETKASVLFGLGCWCDSIGKRVRASNRIVASLRRLSNHCARRSTDQFIDLVSRIRCTWYAWKARQGKYPSLMHAHAPREEGPHEQHHHHHHPQQRPLPGRSHRHHQHLSGWMRVRMDESIDRSMERARNQRRHAAARACAFGDRIRWALRRRRSESEPTQRIFVKRLGTPQDPCRVRLLCSGLGFRARSFPALFSCDLASYMCLAIHLPDSIDSTTDLFVPAHPHHHPVSFTGPLFRSGPSSTTRASTSASQPASQPSGGSTCLEGPSSPIGGPGLAFDRLASN